MVAVLAQVHLPRPSLIPADDSVLGFVLEAPTSPDPLTLQGDVDTLLKNFFNAVATGASNTVANLISGAVTRSTNACFIKYYTLIPTGGTANVPVTPIGPPINTTFFTLGSTAVSTQLPNEVALVLSLHGAIGGIAEDTPGGVVGPRGDIHPRARRRGRLFIGPLQTGVISNGTNGPGFASGVRTDVTKAALKLHDDVLALSHVTSWSIWSRKDRFLYAITGGWCDDGTDTLRRRSIAATNRTTWGSLT